MRETFVMNSEGMELPLPPDATRAATSICFSRVSGGYKRLKAPQLPHIMDPMQASEARWARCIFGIVLVSLGVLLYGAWGISMAVIANRWNGGIADDLKMAFTYTAMYFLAPIVLCFYLGARLISSAMRGRN